MSLPQNIKPWPDEPYQHAAALLDQNVYLRDVVRGHQQTNQTIAMTIAQVSTMKIHSLNANGIRARTKEDAFARYLRAELPDLLLIQEFRCSADKFFARKGIRELLDELRYDTVIINPCNYNVGYAGTAIFARISAEDPEFLDLDEEGRFIAVDCGSFFATNVYTPNSGRPGELAAMPKRLAFDRRLQHKINELRKRKPVIVVGDLNVAWRPQDRHTHWQPEQWLNHPSTTEQEINSFQELCASTNLVDVQAELAMTSFTYWRNKRDKQLKRGTRIDFALVPKSWIGPKPYIHDFSIRQDINTGSDHAVLEFFLDASLFKDTAKGPKRPPAQPLDAVATMVEDVKETALSCLPAACALTRTLDDTDCLSFRNINQSVDHNSEPAQPDQPHTGGPMNHLLASNIADDEYGTVSWDQWPELLDQTALLRHHESTPTIEEASYRDRTHECREERHPFHMSPQPVVLPSISVTIKGRITKTTRALGDTGASSSLIDRAFAAAVLGEEELERQIFRQGYQPTFRTADSRFTSPIGQLRLDFDINGNTFTHVFYVLDACAENVILGGCFFTATKARIDYRLGHLMLEPDEGEPVPCKFEIHRPAGCALQTAATITSAHSYTLPPDTSMVIDARCADKELEGHFGYVAQNTAEPRIIVPRSCTRLHKGATKMVVTNMSPNKFLHIDKGKQVAFFKKANRDDINMYALDLNKLGTAEDAFVDLATLCEQRDAHRAAHPLEPRQKPETSDRPTRHRECLLSCAPSCQSCNTTMPANSCAAFATALPDDTSTTDLTVRDEGMNIITKKKREREREK